MFLNLEKIEDQEFSLENTQLDDALALADLCIAVESSFTDFVVESIELQITNESADEETKKTGMVEKIKNFFKMVWTHISNFFKSVTAKISQFLDFNQKWLDKNKDVISKLGNETFEFKGISGHSPIQALTAFNSEMNAPMNVDNADKEVLETKLAEFKERFKTDDKVTTFKASDAKNALMYLGKDSIKTVKDIYSTAGKEIKKLEQEALKDKSGEELKEIKSLFNSLNKGMSSTLSIYKSLVSSGMAFTKAAVAAHNKANKAE